MDGKDIAKFLISTVGSFTQDHLINKNQRQRHKEQCAERLAAQDGSSMKGTAVRYADQAVLANLDWGIDALEEAINTSNMETKSARLDHAEKMLHVCAMLNSHHTTAGVPNFYLSAWAHLNLALLWKLKNNTTNAVTHILDMFLVDPFFSRIDFAPDLWEVLFLPHMSSIVGWYAEERQRIVLEVMPDSVDLSLTADFDRFFNESLIFTLRPDQAEKLQELEKHYGESLDENTRLYARYYRDCMSFDSTVSKKGIPMMPIAEPPMTPLHEMSRSIPNYVKFGPILPKNAGFSPLLQGEEDESIEWRLSRSNSMMKEEEETKRDDEDVLRVEKDEDYLSDHHSKCNKGGGAYPRETDIESDVIRTGKTVASKSMTSKTDIGSGSKIQPSRAKDRSSSPMIYSPVDSPKTPSPKVPSPKLLYRSEKEAKQILRLHSCRVSHPNDSSLFESAHFGNDSNISPVESEGELEEVVKSRRTKSFAGGRSMDFRNLSIKHPEQSSLTESEEEVSQSSISVASSEKNTPRKKPPKDFVCPITSQLFSDPVTLETGQTYERRAIQEWLKRGNTTCPITRQHLSATLLPKTNYVLKRLITSWREQYPDLAQEFSYSKTPRAIVDSDAPTESLLDSTPLVAFDHLPQNSIDSIKSDKKCKRFTRSTFSTSPTSVISKAALETVINGLKPYTSCLCTSEDLQQCEAAVITIATIWKESKSDSGVHAYLAKPTIVNGFVEILSASLDREVLRTSIYILSELIFADETVGETLTSVDSDFDCLAALLKNGLAEAAVLICQLKPAHFQLLIHDPVPSLVQLILSKSEESDDFQMVMEPKDAALVLLEQILLGGDESSRSQNALNVISMNGLPALVKCLDRTEGRLSAVSIMLCCMRADGSTRNLIANRAELSPVLEIFHAGSDRARSVCIDFISELVCLNRRTFCNQILQIIKDEGAFSTMHTFLVYLQMAPMEQQPIVASLLLQLDLLVEPRKMSIYREEAIETLIEALRRKEFPISQVTALDSLLSLSGRLTVSGKFLTEAWLLKSAGFDQPYNILMKAEGTSNEDDSTETMEEEEKAASNWEKRVAFVLSNHENGSIFKALEECLKSNSLEMAKACLVVATWLTHMLLNLPDTGVRDVARQSLLDVFITVVQSSKNIEDKVLATLALKSFINDTEALKELGKFAKSICKSLRKLKKSSAVVAETLKALMNLPSVNAMELWSCEEVAEADSSANGEVLSLVHLKGRIFSSHSDGYIKIWDAGKRVLLLRLIQEVHEHAKAVTSLFIPPSGDKLYSGSLDKTIRVWAIEQDEIHCLQVHDVKESVYSLAVNATTACYASQGMGAKAYNWMGGPKHINFKQNVKCVAMTDENLYCGCNGYSIQEVDLSKGTVSTFSSGARKLLGKQTIHSLSIQDGHLFAGGSSVDGIAGKVFSLSTKAAIGLIPTGSDIQCIAVNNDFVFGGTKCGIIDVWLRERLTRVVSIKVGGGNTKVTCLTLDSGGEMLFAGSSDGKIKAWSLD